MNLIGLPLSIVSIKVLYLLIYHMTHKAFSIEFSFVNYKKRFLNIISHMIILLDCNSVFIAYLYYKWEFMIITIDK